MLYGAILGDIIGSPYEFDMGDKRKDFPLFIAQSHFTDDSIMTLAVAQAVRASGIYPDRNLLKENTVKSMRKWGNAYPHAGYGVRFLSWLGSSNPKPYHSFGNGSAMRTSAVGWYYETLEETLECAAAVSEVTHNHPEGIKGAKAVSAAIWMARNGKTKEEIRAFITTRYGYDLNRTCDEIRPAYRHVESCQKTVPEAIIAFLEGKDFEDVIRNAVSLGGDCDTLTCIAGSIAEAFYGVDDYLKQECHCRLTPDLNEVLEAFETIQ